MRNQRPNFFSQVYAIARKIPEEKVMTYGQIAKILGTRDARKVGWALHANKDPDIPCHRVVNKDGRLALNYSMGDWKEQKRKLLMEGVRFIDKIRVDLKKSIWKP